MVNKKKLGLVELIITTVASLFGGARAGDVELMHYTPDSKISNERVTISDVYKDGSYISSYPPTLIAYIKDPNSPTGGKLGNKEINPQNVNVVKIDLDSEREVPSDTEHFIRIRIVRNPGTGIVEDYATRNLTLYQEPKQPKCRPKSL